MAMQLGRKARDRRHVRRAMQHKAHCLEIEEWVSWRGYHARVSRAVPLGLGPKRVPPAWGRSPVSQSPLQWGSTDCRSPEAF